jgi:hypothetical protein
MRKNTETDDSLIEKRLVQSASEVKVERTSQQVLNAYKADLLLHPVKAEEAKKVPVYRKLWFKIATPATVCVVGLAVGLGTYYGLRKTTVTETIPTLTNISEKLLYELNTATPFIQAEAAGGQSAIALTSATTARSRIRSEYNPGDDGEMNPDDEEPEHGWNDGFGDPEGPEFGKEGPHGPSGQTDNADLNDIALTYQYLHSKMITVDVDENPEFDEADYRYDEDDYSYVYQNTKSSYSFYLDHDPKKSTKESFSGVYVTGSRSFKTTGTATSTGKIGLAMDLSSTLSMKIDEKEGKLADDNSHFVFTETEGTTVTSFESETDYQNEKKRGTSIYIGKTITQSSVLKATYAYTANEDGDNDYSITYTRTLNGVTLTGEMEREIREEGDTVFHFKESDYIYHV